MALTRLSRGHLSTKSPLPPATRSMRLMITTLAKPSTQASGAQDLSGYSYLTVVPCLVNGLRRVSGGAGEQDTGLVVGRVSVSPAGAFDVFDAGVRGLGTGIGDAVGDQHLDR